MMKKFLESRPKCNFEIEEDIVDNEEFNSKELADQEKNKSCTESSEKTKFSHNSDCDSIKESPQENFSKSRENSDCDLIDEPYLDYDQPYEDDSKSDDEPYPYLGKYPQNIEDDLRSIYLGIQGKMGSESRNKLMRKLFKSILWEIAV